MSVVLTAAALLLARPLSMIFVSYDAALLAVTVRAFSIYSFSFLLCGYNIYASSFFTALNDGFTSRPHLLCPDADLRGIRRFVAAAGPRHGRCVERCDRSGARSAGALRHLPRAEAEKVRLRIRRNHHEKYVPADQPA